MGGEAVQDILIHLDVILRPTFWERSSPFSGHHKALQVLLLPGACGAPASVFFTCSQGNLQHFGTISPNNPVTLPFHPGIRGLRIPQLGWGFLNLSMTPSSSTLISREENSLQSREVAEGMSPLGLLSVWWVHCQSPGLTECLLRPTASWDLSVTVLFGVALQHLICHSN